MCLPLLAAAPAAAAAAGSAAGAGGAAALAGTSVAAVSAFGGAAGAAAGAAGGLASVWGTVSTVLGVLGSVMGIGQQIMQSKSQNDYAEATAEAADQALVRDYHLLNAKQTQVDQKTALEQMERVRQSMRERARIRVAAGEAGLSGNTPMREMVNSVFQSGYDQMIHESNQEGEFMQIRHEMAAARAGAMGRANSVPTSQTNFLGLMSAGVDGFKSGWKLADSLHGFKIKDLTT